MTVEFAPARELLRNAPRKRLGVAWVGAHWRAVVMLIACVCAALATCALGACSGRDGDARVSLTAGASRELADNGESGGASPSFSPSPSTSASTGASSFGDNADSNPDLPANTVRSPAKPFAAATASPGAQDPNAAQDAQDAQTAQNAPLAPPVFHTAD